MHDSLRPFSFFVALVAILFSQTEPFIGSFGKGSKEEHFCEIILKSGHRPKRRCRLKVFLLLALTAILFSRVEPF